MLRMTEALEETLEEMLEETPVVTLEVSAVVMTVQEALGV